jgi:hypothetical protein
VSCVTLRYADAVPRLNAMILTSWLEKETKKERYGIVMLICMNTSYYNLHSDCTHAHNYTYTMMGFDSPKGGKGSVTLRANTC